MAVLLICLLLLTACDTRNPSVCVIDVESPLTAISPFTKPTTATSTLAFALVYSRLALPDTATGELHMDLAESIEYRDRTKAYWITLRSAYFHDGRPVTSYDVAYSILHATRSEKIHRNIHGVIYFDDRTLVIRLKSRVNHLDFLHRIVDIEIVPNDGNESIGSGPYRIESQDEDRIILARNLRFYGPTPRIDRIELVRADKNDSVQRLLSGATDVIEYADSVELPEGQSQLFSASKHNSEYVYALILNNQSPALKDKAVRQAIAHAIDSRAIIDQVLHGNGLPVSSLAGLGSMCAAGNHAVAGCDPSLSTALLEEGGWKKKDDGRLTRDGAVLSIKLAVPRMDVYLQLAEFLRCSLDNLGIDVEIIPVEISDYAAVFTSEPRQWDAVITELRGAYGDNPDYWLRLFRASPSEPALLDHRLLKLTKLQFALPLTNTEKLDLYRQFDEIMQRELLAIPVAQRVSVNLVSRRLTYPIVFKTLELRRFAAFGRKEGDWWR